MRKERQRERKAARGEDCCRKNWRVRERERERDRKEGRQSDRKIDALNCLIPETSNIHTKIIEG